MKTLFVSFLILFTFIGNVGFSVFTHSCKEDGVFRSYIINAQNHCEEETEEVLPACCQKEVQKSCDTIFKDDCCNDEIDIFKINLDYFSQFEINISASSITIPGDVFTGVHILIENKVLKTDLRINPPPKLSGRQILIKNQIFRI